MQSRSKRNRWTESIGASQTTGSASDDDGDSQDENAPLTSSNSNKTMDQNYKTEGKSTEVDQTSPAPASSASQSATTGGQVATTSSGGLGAVVNYFLSFCETSGSSGAAIEEGPLPPNPHLPHDDWVKSLIGSLGKDVSSVCRDFPRQDVKIYFGGRLERFTDLNIVITDNSGATVGVDLFSGTVDCSRSATSAPDAVGLLPANPPCRQPADARDSSAAIAGGNRQMIRTTGEQHSRRDRVIDSVVKVVAIAESINPTISSGSTVAAPEGDETPRSARSVTMTGRVKETLSRLIGAQADLGHGLTIAFTDVEMIFKNPNYSERSTPPPPNAPPPPPGAVNTHRVYLPSPNCFSIDLLMCFNQGVIFFPAQRLRHRTWLPWIQHVHDLGWSCSLFRTEKHGADKVVVWHEQTIENNLVMCNDKERKDTPQFQISWKLELVLGLKTKETHVVEEDREPLQQL